MAPADSAADATAALAAVLTPRFLRKLDRLHLTVRHSLSTRPGNTPMPRGAQGSGIELERYKAYGPGDDLRHLDWNAYARLNQLLVKTFRAEREAPLHLFIDASASMAFPASDRKFPFALSLAAALAYISVRHHDPVRVIVLSGAVPRGFIVSPFFRHRDALPRLRDFLLATHPAGALDLAQSIGAVLREQRSAGVAIVLSDFLMDPAICESALTMLAARRFTTAAIRVIGPAERDPATFVRHNQLVDAETGRQRFITLSKANCARYQDALEAHLQGLRDLSRRCAITCGVADTAAGVEQCLMRDLPALGLIQ